MSGLQRRHGGAGVRRGMRGGGGGPPSPLTILGSADVAFWGNLDNYVPGSGSEITTLTDLTANGRSPTQGTASQRPTVTTRNGKTWANFVQGSSQSWGISATPVPFVASGTATLTVWVTVATPDTAANYTYLDLSTGSANTGSTLRQFNSGGGPLGRCLTGSGLNSTQGSHLTTDETVWRMTYDGDLAIYHNETLDVVEVAPSGTISNNLNSLEIGREAAGSHSSMDLREIVIHAGPTAPTAAQNTAMLAYLLGNK